MTSARAVICAGLAMLLVGCTTSGQQQAASVQRPTQPLTSASQTEYNTLNESVASDARGLSSSEISARISDTTYLRNRPGISNEVIYFAPDQVAYTWATGKKFVETATWTVVSRTPPSTTKASLFICMPFTDTDANGNAVPGRVTNRCFDPAVLYIAAVDRAKGDAFGLRGRKQAPFALPIQRTTIAVLKQQQ